MKTAARILFGAFVVFASSQASAQLATGDPATNFALTDWMTSAAQATDLTFLSDGRAVVTLKSGIVITADKAGAVLKNPAAMFTVDIRSEKGLLGVVRDDQDNLYFYASTGDTNADKHRVYKGRANEDGTITVDLQTPIVTGGLEGPANHDGGGMVIHKGQLYIGVGDTGANRTPPQNLYGQCLNKPNGKILRVNLDGSIPGDNPLNDLASVTGCSVRNGPTAQYEMLPPDKRIYAWGFRNPWRLWIDPRTDLLWIGDVGETTQEEITVGGKGSNHGWPFREGTVAYPNALGGLNDCMAMTPSTTCVAPQDTYAHNGGEASVTGGLVPPTGCGWGAYETKYFFGDYNLGTVWTLDLKPDRSGAVPGSDRVFGTIPGGVVSFRSGPDGAVYVVVHDQGVIKRLAPKTIPAGCNAAQPGPSGTGGSGGSGGAGGSAGAGGSGGAMAGSGGAMAGSGGTGMAPAPAPSDPGGCSCTLAPRPAGGLAAGVLLALGLVVLRRRRR
jgi:MYXO-CTERM domain-containing protein